MKFLRTVLVMLICMLELIVLIPVMLLEKARKASGSPERLKKRELSVQRIVRWWANSILFLSGVTVEVEGMEQIPDRPCVFAGNHQGYFDIIVLLACMDKVRPFIGKKEFRKVPILRSWMENIDCIFIDRNNPRAAIKSLKEAELLLENGKDIYIFPEGTRSQSSEIAPFKPGAVRMANASRSPIVPFFIDGTYRIFEKNGGLISPSKVRISILPPVFTESMDRSRLNQLSQELFEIISQEQKRLEETEMA